MKYIKLILIIFGVLLLSLHSVSSVKAVDCSDTDASSDRYTLSGSCSFPGALLDGIDANGASSTNSAILTVTSGVTLTIPAQQTLATGIIDLKGGGSIVIVKNGQIKLKSPIYMTDLDDDHTPASTSATLIPNAADKRKYTITAPTSSDCNDSYTGYVNTLAANYYPDLDVDTYTTGSTSAGTARCSDQTTWDATTSVTYPGQTANPTSVTLNTRKNSANGNDCNDIVANGGANVFSPTTCYIDVDNDAHTNGSVNCTNHATCSSATYGGVDTATPTSYLATQLQTSVETAGDCNDSSASNAQYVYTTQTCYVDTDNDSYGNTTSKACVGKAAQTAVAANCSDVGYGSAASHGAAVTASDYSNVNTDCNDGVATNSQYVYTAQTCYVDTDNDDYGSTTSKACVGKAAQTAVAANCSDVTYGSASSHGAAVTGSADFSNVNTDCWDNHASYNTTCEPLAFGDGRDGQDLAYTDADYAPSVVASTANTSAGSSTIVTTSNISGLAQGDIVLIANLQGTSGAYADVGEYDFKLVNSVNTGTKTITFFTNLANGYDGTTQKIIVQKIPQYTNITVSGAITPTAWNGTSGGIFAIKATGTVSVPTGTSINASGIGYAGAPASVSTSCGVGGESFCSTTGGGSGGCGGVNGGAASCGGGGGGGSKASPGSSGGAGTATGGAGGGGGKAGSTTSQGNGGGGGAGYGTLGFGGNINGVDGGTDTSGDGGGGIVYTDPSSARAGGGGGGGTYGVANLSKWFFGSGGGAGTYLSIINGGAGGDGGGIVYIAASTVTVTSTGTISADGGNGAAGGASGASYSGAGGGGAGGSIYILGNTVTLGTNLVTADNGVKGGSTAGNGGDGRIAVGATTKTGTTTPTYTSITAP